ncbi:MAG: TonB-dependent receptor [Acidobacteria bacterium]|nr:TonB-dependent receptor [Acidobacteriota bacterium]
MRTICLASFLLFAASLSAAQPVPSIDIRVIDEHTGLAIPDALVSFDAASGGSDAVPVQVTADGYEARALAITAATPRSIIVRLRRLPPRVDEHVVVTAGRARETLTDVPRAVSVVTRADLDARLPGTTPDALMDTAGVLVQKTNLGAGAPYVRGLVGNQILVLIDGVRLNNATYRFGPNQYLGTVDPDMLGAIEVVRGPGSVLYGSDAIGGVVNLVTRTPEFSAQGWTRTFESRAGVSAGAAEQRGRLGFSAANATWALRGGVSAHNTGDMRAGGHRGTLSPSGYSEAAGDVAAAVRLAPGHLLTATVQVHHQDDVPRWDQVVQRGFSRYAFDPQTRQLGSLRYTAQALGWADAVAATASFQSTDERRRIQRAGSVTDTTERDRVRTLGLSMDVQKRLSPGLLLQGGGEVYADEVGSTRVDVDTRTGAALGRRGLYPDGATATSAAVFARGVWTVGRVRAEAGTRFSSFRIAASDATFRNLDVTPSAWVRQAGASVRLVGQHLLFGSLAQSFRAPNIDDVSTLGRFDSGIEVPSPGLTPERGLTSELGLRTRSRAVSATVVAFRTDLTGLIDRVRANYQGSPVFEDQPVFQKANVGEARVTGGEVEVEWRAGRAVTVTAHATATRGQALTRNEPMRRIPPVNGGLAVQWRPRAAAWAGLSTRWATRQDRLSSGDLADHRISSTGTPAWMTVDAFGAAPLSRRLQVTGGVRNLFDRLYRVHGSGIDAPGVTAWLAIGIRP